MAGRKWLGVLLVVAAVTACDKPPALAPVDPYAGAPADPPTMESGFRADANYHAANVRLEVRYRWSTGQSDLTLRSPQATIASRNIDTIFPDPAFDVIVSVITPGNDTLATTRVGWRTQAGWRYGVGVSVSRRELPNMSCASRMKVPLRSGGAVPDTMFVYYLGVNRIDEPVC